MLPEEKPAVVAGYCNHFPKWTLNCLWDTGPQDNTVRLRVTRGDAVIIGTGRIGQGCGQLVGYESDRGHETSLPKGAAG